MEKKNSKVLLICSIVLVILVIGCLGFLYTHKSSPEKVFSTLIEKANKEVKNKVDLNQVSTDFELSFKVDAGEEAKEMTDLINALLLKGNVNVDLKTNELVVGLKADYENKELINVKSYTDTKTMYIDLNDLFDKVLSLKLETEENKFELNVDDVKTIYEEVYKAVKLALEEGTYTKKDAEVNGSKVTENILTIDNNNKDKIVKAFVNYLKDNDKFISALSKLTGEKKDDIKSMLNEEVKLDELKDTYTISIFTKGLNNDLVKVSFSENNTEILSVVKASKDTYDMKFSIDKDSMNCTIKEETKNKVNSTCKLEIEGVKVEYNYKIEVKENQKLEKPNISNSVSIENLTEEDTNKIMENLSKKDGVEKIMELISSMTPQMDEDYNFDEDYTFDE